MFQKFVFICCFVLICAPAYSGESEHRALAEELIKITDSDTVMDKMKVQMTMVFEQIKAQLNLADEDRTKLEKYTARFEAIMDEDMAWDKVKEQYIDLYTKTFSEADLKGLVDFHKSDLGRKLSANMPELMQQSMLVSQAQMQIVIPKLEGLTEEMHKEFVPAQPEASEKN